MHTARSEYTCVLLHVAFRSAQHHLRKRLLFSHRTVLVPSLKRGDHTRECLLLGSQVFSTGLLRLSIFRATLSLLL